MRFSHLWKCPYPPSLSLCFGFCLLTQGDCMAYRLWSVVPIWSWACFQAHSHIDRKLIHELVPTFRRGYSLQACKNVLNFFFVCVFFRVYNCYVRESKPDISLLARLGTRPTPRSRADQYFKRRFYQYSFVNLESIKNNLARGSRFGKLIKMFLDFLSKYFLED